MDITKYMIKLLSRINIAYIFILIVTAVFMFPVIWMIFVAFTQHGESSVWMSLDIDVSQINFRNFFQGWKAGGGKGILDSFIVSTSTTIFTLILATPAAYSIARYKTGGNNLSFTILSFRMMPAIVPAIALYLLLVRFGLYDSHLGLIMIYTTFNVPFAIWILKGFFEEIPRSIEEAAWIDGVTRGKALVDMILPLVTPGLVATALFCLIFSWNEFLFSLIMTFRNVQTFPVVIPKLVIQAEPKWGEIAAMGLLSIIPIIVLAFFLQRYLVRALSLGAVRG